MIGDMWRNRPSAVRKRLADRAAAYARHGLTDADVTALARYNSDRSRGLVVDQEYAAQMADLQQRFNRASADLTWGAQRPA